MEALLFFVLFILVRLVLPLSALLLLGTWLQKRGLLGAH